MRAMPSWIVRAGTRRSGVRWRFHLAARQAGVGELVHFAECIVDCDADTLLALVEPAGPACHTGATTCFYRSFQLP